jgi:cell division protein FtsB
MALVIVLFCVLASYLNPLVNFVDAWRDSVAGKEQLAELQRENAELERRAAEAASPQVLQREARRLGLVREDERAYVIRGLPD